MPLLPWLSLPRATPSAAVALGTLGLLLIFFELNRPGRVWAGSLGLLFFLLATGRLLRCELQPWAVVLLALASAAFLLNLYRPLPLFVLLFSTAAGVLGLRFLLLPSQAATIHLAVATTCGVLLGVASGTLTRIAFRARRAKALN